MRRIEKGSLKLRITMSKFPSDRFRPDSGLFWLCFLQRTVFPIRQKVLGGLEIFRSAGTIGKNRAPPDQERLLLNFRRRFFLIYERPGEHSAVVANGQAIEIARKSEIRAPIGCNHYGSPPIID